MKHNAYIHHRRSIRLKGYNYSKPGAYFITICCHDRAHLFGEIVNGEMVLNKFGMIAHNEWLKTPEIRKNVELDVFVIMPNHMHAIIILNDPGHTGRGELHSPDTNRFELPDTNKFELPDTNKFELPETNRFELPDTNKFELPETNKFELPETNKFELPETNRFELPDTNRFELPDTNKFELPETNRFELPDTNKFELPDTNKFELPDTNRFELPDTNKFELQDTNRFELPENTVTGECNSPPRGPSNNIGAIVRGYKSSVTKQLNLLHIGCIVWQRNYHEHIIRNDRSYQTISKYIINNPSKWTHDKFYYI